MATLLRLYETGFRRVVPDVRFEENLQNTLTAVSGVYTGSSDVGLLGREIWPAEVAAFAAAAGHPPLVIEIATGSYDVPKATFALMVFVHHGNPIASLSLPQLARIFGDARSGAIRTWGDAGLRGTWASRPIHLYGFAPDNDKARIFRQLVFVPDEHWSPDLRAFSNTAGPDGEDAGAAIARAVADDPDGIGISNIAYAVHGVRVLAIASNASAPVMPSRATVTDRTYPLSRAVYVVLNSGPSHPLSPATREFLRFVLSRQGEQAVAAEGNYLPLPDALVIEQLGLLAGEPRGRGHP
jgi:phosphate transport system substrate-binding protein